MRQIKTMITLLFFLSMMISSMLSVQADPSVLISSYTWDPEVFMPGDSGSLTLTITNAEAAHTITSTSTIGGTTTARVDSVGVFFNKIWLVADSDGTHEFRAGEYFTDILYLAPASSFELVLPVVAEDNLVENTYYPLLRIDVQSYDDVKYPIPVQVSNSSVDLLAAEVPSTISFSGSTQITLSVVNNHEGSINSLQVIPQTLNNINVTPAYQVIESLAAHSSEDVTFSLLPETTGSYDMTFNLIYNNGNNEHTSSLHLSFDVVETPDVSPILYEVPSSIEQGSTEKLRLKVYNAKAEAISGVVVTPVTNAFITPSQYFIGTLAANDEYSVSFEVDATTMAVGDYSIDFAVSFKQHGQTFETTPVTSSFSVTEVVPPDTTAETAGGVIFLIIVVSIIAFYIYRRRRS